MGGGMPAGLPSAVEVLAEPFCSEGRIVSGQGEGVDALDVALRPGPGPIRLLRPWASG